MAYPRTTRTNHNQTLYIFTDVDIQVHFTALKAFEKVQTVRI